MAHQIDSSNGRFNMAFIGEREAVWHGLGQQLTENESIDVWKQEAGMEWVVQESPITFNNGCVFDGKKALFRSDTKAQLSIVADEYKIVQPGDVLEFFRDLTEDHGMKLSTAGCLFGGQRFWALAETGNTIKVSEGDEVDGYLLFITSVDGTLSSCAKFVSTRVVCNNTLTVALGESGKKAVIRKTHHSIWDSKQVKIDLGLLNGSWDKFKEELLLLSNRKMSDSEVKSFFEKTCFDPKKEKQGWGVEKNVETLLNLYKNGAGAEMGFGTAYGALQAVTNLYTHGTGRKSVDSKFWSAYVLNDGIKETAKETLLELC